MSDPIKDALGVAGEAVRAALIRPGCCMEGTGCELPPCHCSMVAAQVAVAAFHREMERIAGPYTYDAACHRLQAAAVERAAKGGGDE
jgi:hypothetical protein